MNNVTMAVKNALEATRLTGWSRKNSHWSTRVDKLRFVVFSKNPARLEDLTSEGEELAGKSNLRKCVDFLESNGFRLIDSGILGKAIHFRNDDTGEEANIHGNDFVILRKPEEMFGKIVFEAKKKRKKIKKH